MEGKSLGEVAYGAKWGDTNLWDKILPHAREAWDRVAAAVVAAHEERKAKEIQCVRCGKAFQDRSDMLLHIAEDH